MDRQETATRMKTLHIGDVSNKTHLDINPLTIAQCSQRLNLSQATIRAWVRSNRIGYTRLGRSLRIPGSEVSRLLTEGWNPPTPTPEDQ